ncbi:stress response ish1 [Trichoderma cornu-damae]|uniref:Stress response ish1 n=1 Tax=Trichoderma cornu-damae TaxID=654480 RepID=A0A9P8TZU5_9HYPO|nr:stress response ish1 [Trichoderma cornu-damae]
MWRLRDLLIVGLAVSGAAASNWFPGSKAGGAVYNKWHETELERWLSDQNIPYPTPADRKDLEDLISKNWNDYVVEPYKKWDTSQLSAYLQARGNDAVRDAQKNKDSLLSQVKSHWYETEETANQAWVNVKDWILDTWTDSQLKAFCDKHGVPVPQPRTRDALLQKAREAYEQLAEKAGETAAYPGDWLYSTWTASDLKEWLDTHGFPAPQPTSRDKLIASVRRNSRLAYLKAREEAESASARIQAAYTYLTDTIIDAWGESQLKGFCDKNGIPVPQGTKINELRALVRKHRADILGDTIGASAKAAFGAATSSVQGQYARATEGALLSAQEAFNQAVGRWSDSRLKAYLDARGIPVPQAGRTDELRALVRKHSHRASAGWQAWNFDDFGYDNLKNYLSKNGDAAAKAAAKKKGATRDDLVSAAQSAYSSASSAGGAQYASATSYLASVTAAAKHNAFEAWSESELKAYLDSYGVPVPKGSKIDELKAEARKQSAYFKYGSSSPGGTLLAKMEEAAGDGWRWICERLGLGSEAEAKEKGQKLRKEL